MVFRCTDCSRDFAGKAAYASYRYRIHGEKNPIRRYLIVSDCCFCFFEIHTRERHAYHVTSNARCRAYALTLPAMSLEETEALDIECEFVQPIVKLVSANAKPRFCRSDGRALNPKL